MKSAKQRTLPHILISLTIVAVLLFVFFEAVYLLTQQSWALSCAITFGVITYHFAIRFLSPVIISAISHKKYNYKSVWFRQKSWERVFYKFIKVKSWKKITNIFTYHADDFSPRKHTWAEIVNNMCHAEVVHEFIVVFSLASMLFIIPFGSVWVFVITAVLAAIIDLIFVIIQRFNRPRVIKILKRYSSYTKNFKS